MQLSCSLSCYYCCSDSSAAFLHPGVATPKQGHYDPPDFTPQKNHTTARHHKHRHSASTKRHHRHFSARAASNNPTPDVRTAKPKRYNNTGRLSLCCTYLYKSGCVFWLPGHASIRAIKSRMGSGIAASVYSRFLLKILRV